MTQVVSQTLKTPIVGRDAVTVKVDRPDPFKPDTPLFVIAHGANNDLDFPLLAYLAAQLASAGRAAVVRFNFPYVERGTASPDARPILEQTFQTVYEEVASPLSGPAGRIFVGGKSLGGRTAAELVSRRLEGGGVVAAGLIILGYPLHAMGKEERLFLEPLRHIDIPSLFCVGTRDPLCNPDLLRPVLAGLEHPGRLYVVEGGDHSLHLPKSSGQPDNSYPGVAKAVGDFIAEAAAAR